MIDMASHVGRRATPVPEQRNGQQASLATPVSTIMTSANLELDNLAADIRCEGTKRSVGCPRLAKYVVRVHVLDCCRARNLSANGELVVMLCSKCTETTVHSVASHVNKLFDQSGGRPVKCKLCDVTVRRLADLLTVEHV